MNDFYKALIILGLMVALTGAHIYDKRQAVNAVHAVYEAEKKANEQKSKAATEAIKLKAEQDIKERDVKIKTISAKLASLSRELQQRPSRSSAASKAGPSCTGAELPREDGEFLAREAARADTIREQRDFYYRRYEEARETLERLRNGKD